MTFDFRLSVINLKLDSVLRTLDNVTRNLRRIMAKVDELKDELIQINNVTNEIAADIDDLVAKVGTGAMSTAEADEVKAQLVALKDRLTGIASTHTP